MAERTRQITLNKNALRNYHIIESLEAGIVLQGTEVKSLTAHEVTIKDAYVLIRGNAAWLLNLHIPPYKFGNIANHVPDATRKLLLSKRQLIAWAYKQKSEGATIIPVSIYWKNNKIKVQIALAKALKKHDKRDQIKKRDMERQTRKVY